MSDSLGSPWSGVHQPALSFTISWSLLRFMFIESVMPSNRLILCLPFSSCPQSFPASGSFLVSWVFTSGGQNIGALASASVLPMNIQGWFLLRLTGLILQSKGLSRVFSNTTVQWHQFFCYLVGISCSCYSSIDREFETKYPQQGSMVEWTVPESGRIRFKF